MKKGIITGDVVRRRAKPKPKRENRFSRAKPKDRKKGYILARQAKNLEGKSNLGAPSEKKKN